MKTIKIHENVPVSSVIGLGCMRLAGLGDAKAVRELVEASMEAGINFFDHADIYGGGESETIFGRAVTPQMRSRMVLQTKCGIRPGVCYDFSREHILKSVEVSLKRLNTDYIDILLLHRPDALMEPEEVASAFDQLKKEGKVRCFGVSNQNPMQMELLNSYLSEPLAVNQIQFSVAHCPTIDAGLNVNMCNEFGCSRDGSVIEYCRLKKVTIQSWSPFQYGMIQGVFIGNEKFPELNRELTRLAEKYQVSENAIAVAWIMRHPAGIQTIVGSMKAGRVREICRACEVPMTREEWYGLYRSAGKDLP